MKIKGMTRFEHQFPAFIYHDAEILVLGSFPSVKSRDESFYYMHPQNRFWKLLSLIYDDDFEHPDIKNKKNLLKKHKIALYDVIESCQIIGSKDSSISDVTPTDIKSLIEGTNVKTICLNGRKAFELFKKYNPFLKGIYLPSTSPANARFSMEDLYVKWIIIK